MPQRDNHEYVSSISSMTYDELMAAIAKVSAKKLSSVDAPRFDHFCTEYFERFSLDDLAGRQLEDVFSMAYSCWLFLTERDAGRAKVQLLNPVLEEDGWVSSHTALMVLQDDMPFLVDSIRMELTRRNIAINTIKSTLLNVQRKKGVLQKLGSGGVEAFIYVEIGKHTNSDENDSLTASIFEVLADVAVVVADYQSILTELESAEAHLVAAAPALVPETVEESCEFLQWLKANHFTFLGYSEYAFVDRDGGRFLEEIAESRKGLFRLQDQQQPALSVEQFNQGMERFHLTPQPLTFSKSSVRSRVHRQAYSDYIIIKRFDGDGKVCGESRFLGLYTSPVYTFSPYNIPLVRQKVTQALERSGLDLRSHSGKQLRQVLETFPRDELFLSSSSELFETSTAVARINERYRVRLFMRKDPYGKFVSAIIYIPRDIFNTRMRIRIQEMIAAAINAKELEFTTHFSESILARVHVVFRVDPEDAVEFDAAQLEARVIDLARTWEDLLRESIVESHGEEKGLRLYQTYSEGFGSAYRDSYDGRSAVHDIDRIETLSDDNSIAMSFYRPAGVDNNIVRFKVFHRDVPIELSVVVPVLEHLGLRVIGEQPYKIKESGGREIHLHDFYLRFDLDAKIDIHASKEYFQEAFEAIWFKCTDSDAFNRLVLGAQLDWREVAILRTYARYMKQTAFNFSQTYIADTLANHLDITRNLVALFKAQFDPEINLQGEEDKLRVEALRDEIIDSLERVQLLNEDRIIRRYLEMIAGTLRTNFYRQNEAGENRDFISIKLSPRNIENIPEPRPLFEIFVYSPRIEGVHLRGGKVARGGLRWSDRLQDYRTEVLGLVKAQQVKNAVIVPSGAKGGFVAKRLPDASDREAFMAEGVACYQTFIRGLLDVTDNLVDGDLVPPPKVVRLDEDDPYLVVAADKGTATFSDIANEISVEYGHWLGDAFASGGSQGYDHKAMGITARGAWVSVQRHFKEIGVDIQREDFSVIGVGDMAGDVFGNGMLLSEHICLNAAFNHLHIFIDPNPDSAKSFIERKRLFETPRTSWADYDKTLISKGGGVFERSAKSIAISPQMRECFGIDAKQLSPAELLTALLKAPVDLIWNGGIGTYVKASAETHAEVGDKANDGLRVNGSELRCKVFGEGGNLGMTQKGRIEFSLSGGACNTDFIDNAAGVDCSDHEVNIKILLNELVVNDDMTEKQRNQLLSQMTDEVSGLVLDNNYRQTQAISIAQSEVEYRVGEYRRLINALESEGRLNRQLEFLPEDEIIVERHSQGKNLTRPELSVLISYVKAGLKEDLVASDIPEDAYIASIVEAAFPARLRKKYKKQIYNHRLRREIVATQVANDMVDNMGISFCHRLVESTGSSVAHVAKAYMAARDIFQFDHCWQQVKALDHKVPAKLQLEMISAVMRRVRRATRWILRNRRSQVNPKVEVEFFAEPIAKVFALLPEYLDGKPKKEWQERYEKLVEQGVGEEFARRASVPTNIYSGLSVIEASRESNSSVELVLEVYVGLSETLGLNVFSPQIASLSVGNYWQAMARETYIDDLEWQIRTLSVSLIGLMNEGQAVSEAIELWCKQHKVLLDRWYVMISDLKTAGKADYAMFSVALRELLDLAQASQHCTSFDVVDGV